MMSRRPSEPPNSGGSSSVLYLWDKWSILPEASAAMGLSSAPGSFPPRTQDTLTNDNLSDDVRRKMEIKIAIIQISRARSRQAEASHSIYS